MTQDFFSADHLTLEFHNTPRELFDLLDTIWAKSRWLGPFRFSYTWRKYAAGLGRPALTIHIPLTHSVPSRSDYRVIAEEVAMEFEKFGLKPVRRFNAASTGTYDPPSAPGASFDPDICFMLGN